jgi:hypothetical protein
MNCSICLDAITNGQEIYNCKTCYGSLHLDCANHWAQHLIYSSYKEYKCPMCSTQVLDTRLPLISTCFCGKTRNTCQHSCTKICNRLKKCGHTCNSVCHESVCPPCSVTHELICGCGRNEYKIYCGETVSDDVKNVVSSCGQQCNKLLNCQKHACQRSCHHGKCKKCSVVHEQKCHCGSTVEQRTCSSSKSFSCKIPCTKVLPCNHICSKKCHPGSCDKCSFPCDQIRTNCGHKCIRKCHTRNCNEFACGVLVEMKCPCERISAQVKCSNLTKVQQIQCNDICNKVKHIMNQVNEFELDPDTWIPKYSYELIQFAKKHSKFVKNVEQIFDKLVNISYLYDSYPFDPMPLWKRQYLYEIANHYYLDHYAVDSDKNRIPCIRKTEYSSRPFILLSQVADESEEYIVLKIHLERAAEERRLKELNTTDNNTNEQQDPDNEVMISDDIVTVTQKKPNKRHQQTRNHNKQKKQNDEPKEYVNPWNILLSQDQ